MVLNINVVLTYEASRWVQVEAICALSAYYTDSSWKQVFTDYLLHRFKLKFHQVCTICNFHVSLWIDETEIHSVQDQGVYTPCAIWRHMFLLTPAIAVSTVSCCCQMPRTCTVLHCRISSNTCCRMQQCDTMADQCLEQHLPHTSWPHRHGTTYSDAHQLLQLVQIFYLH